MGKREISSATIARMPQYLRYLQGALQRGERYVSSAEIAKSIAVSAVLVRKDLSIVSSIEGRPRLGFEIRRLVGDIEKFLGYDNLSDAVVVGAGALGKAFLGYEGFKNNGLNVVAAFDVDPEIVGKSVNGKQIYHVSQLSAFVRSRNIRIGILTVPKGAAQAVLDELVAAGVRGVWNFAATDLTAPKEVVVKTEDLSASLAFLAGEMIRRSI